MEAKITSAGRLFQICEAMQLKALLANAIRTSLVTARRDDEVTIMRPEQVPVSSALQVNNVTAYIILSRFGFTAISQVVSHVVRLASASHNS